MKVALIIVSVLLVLAIACIIINETCTYLLERKRKRFKHFLIDISIDKDTNLPFVDNYLSYKKGETMWNNLWDYLDYLYLYHSVYMEYNEHESLKEYLDRIHPPLKNKKTTRR